MLGRPSFFVVFFFNDTATTEIYTLSLHDALPICFCVWWQFSRPALAGHDFCATLGLVTLVEKQTQLADTLAVIPDRSEEHTSELQSRLHLVCRLLLEKKKKTH